MGDLIRSTRRRARTRKPCFLCGEHIQPGWAYDDNRFAFNGRAYSWAEHIGCATHLRRIDTSYGYDEVFEGHLATVVEEDFGVDWSALCRRWRAWSRALRVAGLSGSTP